jgi:hypothetical protein
VSETPECEYCGNCEWCDGEMDEGLEPLPVDTSLIGIRPEDYLAFKESESTISTLKKKIEELEKIIEDLWKETGGCWPSTGAMWFTPRMDREAKALQEGEDAD